MSDSLVVGPTLYRDIRRARDYAQAGREAIKEQALTKPDGLLLLNALNDIELAAEVALEIIERNNPKLSVVQEEDPS